MTAGIVLRSVCLDHRQRQRFSNLPYSDSMCIISARSGVISHLRIPAATDVFVGQSYEEDYVIEGHDKRIADLKEVLR